MGRYQDKIRMPPSDVTGELGRWLQELWGVVNSMPRMSWFSGVSPNTSGLTGVAGDLAVNIGSASTDSRVWVKSGSPSVPSTANWVVLRTLA